MAASQELTAQVHTIIRTTIGQYYVNQAVSRGVPRAKIQPGSVTFIQRFGSAINLNLYFHCVFLEGVYLDRTEAGLKPRFVKGEPPSDADIAAVVQTVSRRVIRTLRRLGYLEAGLEAAVATGHDPLVDDAPELARTLAASVQQRIVFGERAGQKVRRLGAGFGAEDETPTLTGPRCASLQGFSLHANTQVPAHQRDQLERLIRYTARCHVPGAPDPRRQWRSALHLYPSVVGRHHGGPPLAIRALGEAGRARAAAARPPGTLWGRSDAA
jgi:putative transposase